MADELAEELVKRLCRNVPKPAEWTPTSNCDADLDAFVRWWDSTQLASPLPNHRQASVGVVLRCEDRGHVKLKLRVHANTHQDALWLQCTNHHFEWPKWRVVRTLSDVHIYIKEFIQSVVDDAQKNVALCRCGRFFWKWTGDVSCEHCRK